MNDPDYYPDGLTPDAINAIQREVDDELRREGYPVQYGQRPYRRLSGRRAAEPTHPARVSQSVPPSRAEQRVSPIHRCCSDGGAANEHRDAVREA